MLHESRVHLQKEKTRPFSGVVADDLEHVLEKREQLGDVPLAIAELVDEAALRLRRPDTYGLIERGAGGAYAQVRVEDQQPGCTDTRP